VGLVSKARKELLQSFSKSHTFMIRAGTAVRAKFGAIVSDCFLVASLLEDRIYTTGERIKALI
jgi:hypothetical protein